ncbi:MAG: hypothetical protein JSU68_01990 [Phycisphaerales bacterium]|nr:MAG: hypothetical protein JSU68_01990 [Phycisphaerales bacterium]
MKAQRRQELKTNELAETLRQAREFLEKYGTYVAGAVVVVVVILGALLWHRNSQLAEHRRQWEDYYNLERDAVQFVVASLQGTEVAGANDLEGLVSRYKARVSAVSDPRVRLLLLEGLGDFCWAYAVNALGEGSDAATKARALEEATGAFEQITRDFSDDEWSVGKAMMALAVIAEEQGDFDRAQELYRRITSVPASEGTSLAELAEEALVRVDDLREPIVFAPAPPVPEKIQGPAVFGPQLEPQVTVQGAEATTIPVVRRLGEDEEGPSSPAETAEEETAAGGSSDEEGGVEGAAVSPSTPGESPATWSETSDAGVASEEAQASEGADESEAADEEQPGTRSE